MAATGGGARARGLVPARGAQSPLGRRPLGPASGAGELPGEQPAAEIDLELSDNGKPQLRNGDRVEFNLSHSNGLALIAVAEGREVGVDVELIEPKRDLVALAERALPQEDAVTVREANEPERPTLFYAAWTRHEARLKCLGTGLGAAVENVDVAPGYAAAVAVAAPEVGPIDCRSLRAG